MNVTIDQKKLRRNSHWVRESRSLWVYTSN